MTIDSTELAYAAREMVDLMEDALGVHIYSLEDGDSIPANDAYVAAIDRVRAALGIPAADIETTPVWSYSATFADRNGERASYSTEVVAADAMAADAMGRADLELVNRGASKVDASVRLIAARVEG